MRQQINHHWFRQWHVAWTAPSHYLNQCWNIVNWTLGNKLQWNFNWNLNIFVQENAFENVVCEMGSILSRPQLKFLWYSQHKFQIRNRSIQGSYSQFFLFSTFGPFTWFNRPLVHRCFIQNVCSLYEYVCIRVYMCIVYKRMGMYAYGSSFMHCFVFC